jgi:thermitase
VWHAQVKKEDSGAIESGVAQGNGTSFAVAAVAGLAALWLSYHDREKLIERYGIEKIPFLFNRILRESCDPVPDWEPGKFGSGLVNAEKLLATPLPERVEEILMAPAVDLEEHLPIDWGGIEAFNHLFSQSLLKVQQEEVEETEFSGVVLEDQLADLLSTNAMELPRKLKRVGQEVSFQFATNPDLYKKFVSAMSQEQMEPKALRMAEAAPAASSMTAIKKALLSKETSEVLCRSLDT